MKNINISHLFTFIALFLTSFLFRGETYIDLDGNGPSYSVYDWVFKGSNNIVYWSSHTLNWRLEVNGAGDGFTYNQTQALIDAAYDTWQNVTSSDITFNYAGSVSGSYGNDNINGHYWVYSGDPLYSTVFNPDQLDASAVTIFTCNNYNKLLDVDIVYNGNKDWYDLDDGGTWLDIQAVATHEIGHSIGLGHTFYSTMPYPVMNSPNNPANNRRILKSEDNEGVSFLYGGNLIDNETFSELDYYNWDLTVPYGYTLTIQSGSSIYFKNSSSLTVNGTLNIGSGANLYFINGGDLIINGTLNAVGNSSNRITFTSSSSNPSAGDWNGIRIINGNSGSVLDYCEIKYATNGIYVDNTEIDVKNSFIHHNSYNGVSSVNGANVFLQYNSITNNGGYGVYGDNDSEVYLGAYYTTGGNRVNNNNVGINCINDSYMFAGRYDWLPCYNSVYSNTVRAANAMFGGDIKTEVTWWGTASPSSTLFLYNGYGGTIDYSDWLTYDPGYGSPLAKRSAPGLTSTTVNNKDPKSLYEAGYYYYGSNNEMAVKLWKELIDRYPENEYAPKALVRLFHLDMNDKSMGIQGYITNIERKIEKTSKLNEKVKILKAYKAMQDNNIETASLLVSDMINSFKDSRGELYGLYTLSTCSKFGDTKKALKNLSEKYPDEMLTLIARELNGEKVGWSIHNETDTIIRKEKINIINAEEFSLGENYPNPFNPSTTINYSLPEAGNVQIKIFDVLGREVAKLVDETKSAGKHTVAWNGSNNASGIYFYTITFNNQTLYKKMLMLK